MEDASNPALSALRSNSPPVLSIVLPVRNDAPSVNIMVRILDTIIEVPNEVIAVYDDPTDTSVAIIEQLRGRYPCLRGIHNDIARGLLPALRAGIAAAQGQYVLIYAADEIGPVLAIKDMLHLMEAGCDFVSATRYAGGGRRYGGSLLGHILSRTANFIFGLCSASALSDCTSGMKMFRRDIFDRLKIVGRGGEGWSCAFEMAISAQLLGLRIGEVAIVSIDRLFGGQSTFRPVEWVTAYLRVFLWGLWRLPPWYSPRPRLAFSRRPRI